MSLRRQGVVLGGEAIIVPLQGDIRSLDVLVSPEAGATALVEYTASNHFVGASKQVGISQSAPVATFIAPDSLSLADFAAHGITQPGQVFQILGTASNDGFYRILEFLTGPSSPGAAGSQFAASGSVYSINARDFPTGEADSDEFTVSFWIKQPSGFPDSGNFIKSIITSLRNTVPEPGFAGSTPYSFGIAKSPPTSMIISSNPLGFLLGVNEGFADTWPGDGLWHHILISADISLGTAHIFVDGVDREQFQVLIPGSIQWEDPSDHLTHSIGGTHQRLFNGEFTATLDAELSEIYFDPQNYLDFTIQSNRELFRSAGGDPVDLGPIGATPTTAQPAVYCPDGDPAANVGRWGPYTLIPNSTPAQTPVVATAGPALDTARVLPIDGGMINEDAAPDVGVFSGPSAGAASIWVPWSEDSVTVDTRAPVPSSSSALMITATAGDVEFTINGGKSREQAAPVVVNPPLGARLWQDVSFNKHVGVISNVVDGRNGTLSFWFKKPAGSVGHILQLQQLFDVSMADQDIRVRAFQSGGGSQQLVVDTGTTGFTPDVWNHYMLSWENTFPVDVANVTQYLNGVELVHGVNGISGFAGGLDVDLGYAGSNMWQGTDDMELNTIDEICLSEFYLNLEERVDLTDVANREKFRSPTGDAVLIGGNGSGVTGIQPAFYASNGELNPNAGKSDNLSTITGEILNCIDAPTKSNPDLDAKEWDGGTYSRFTGVSGVADGRVGTCSFWMNVPDSTTPQGNDLLAAGNSPELGFLLFYDSLNNQIVLLLKGVGSSNNRMTFISNKVVPDQWQHVMMSWEHTFPIDSAAHMTMYIDGVEITTGGGDLLDQINIDEDLNYLTGSWTQGQAPLGFPQTNPLNGCLSEFYFNTDERIDLTDADNRAQFISVGGDAVNIGGDGSGPSGSQPAFYASDGDLTNNAGYVPNMSIVAGALLNCATAPTKVAPPNPPLGAREWDGASFNEHVGVISNVVDGRNGSLSFWFKKAAGDTGTLFRMTDRFDLVFADQFLNIIIQQTGGGLPNQVVVSTGTTGWTPDVWNHYMVSWENTFPISTANVTQYLNGVELIDGVDSVAGFAGGLDVDLGYAGSNMWQGTDDTETDNLEICLSEFYLNLEERIDLTDVVNREKFRSAGGDAIEIGGDGSGVTGSQPAFYASNGEVNPNAGKSDDLSTITGGILNCIDAPTKVPPFYVGLASDFNGAVLLEDTNGPLVSGQADGRLVTFSVWYKNNSDPSNDQEIIRIQNSVSQRAFSIRVSFPRGQALVASTAASTSNALVACSPATSSSQIADGWNHFMGSMEHLLPQNEVVNITAYFNGVLIVDGVSGAILDQQAFDFDIAYNSRGEEVVQGSNGFPTPGDFLDGCLSNLYVNIEERLDLTIQANREKFYSATGKNVFLGADGSLPTGTQPFIYAEDGDLRVNDGYGPSLALIQGVIAACSDRPPEG